MECQMRVDAVDVNDRNIGRLLTAISLHYIYLRQWLSTAAIFVARSLRWAVRWLSDMCPG